MKEMLTIRSYVLAMASGPFLPLRQALLEVATGSVAYVCSLFDLIDPSISDQLRTETVVAGFYGLHNYVSVYWLYHLSQLAQVYRGIEEVSDPNLSKIIETLCARHFELTRTSSTSQRSTGDFVKPDPRSAFFEQHQGLHSIAQEVWAHEMLSSEKQMVDLPGECGFSSFPGRRLAYRLGDVTKVRQQTYRMTTLQQRQRSSVLHLSDTQLSFIGS